MSEENQKRSEAAPCRRIRLMQEADRETVLAMMRIFYASDAVLSNGSEEIYQADIDACLSDNPHLEGYILEKDHQPAGYAMLAKSFSTEFGRPCVWIEDLYLTPENRGCGLAGELFDFVRERFPNAVHRLEVERENEHAVHVYERKGFDELPYVEMIRQP